MLTTRRFHLKTYADLVGLKVRFLRPSSMPITYVVLTLTPTLPVHP